MNSLNFNRAASGTSNGGGSNALGGIGGIGGGAATGTGGAPSPGGYSQFLARPSPGGTTTANSATSPFNRAFPFGNSSLPPHLANFSNPPGSTPGSTATAGGQASLNINDFPALGGSFNAAHAIDGGAMSYANSTVGNRSGAGATGEALNNDDFPALSGDGGFGAAGGLHANGASTQAINQEQASAAATLQHQRLAREQNQSQQTLNAARGGFGDADRDYATKVGMHQPPGIAAAQNWFSAAANFGAAGANPTGLNGSSSAAAVAAAAGALQSPALANQVAQQALDGGANVGGLGAAGATGGLMLPNVGPAGAMPAQSIGATAKTPAQQVLTSPADRFGLVGLLNIIKMQDSELSMLTMGSDLQTLGMNMAAQDPIAAAFVTPWSDNAAAAASQVEPNFHLPSCYNVQPPPPAQNKIASFSDETLFFIFYSAPRDVLQEIAAQELYNRNWRFYRGGLNLWLTKEENVQPTHKDLRAEKGVYIFWDPATWSKVSREFVLAYDALEERSMGVSPAQMLAGGGAAGGPDGAMPQAQLGSGGDQQQAQSQASQPTPPAQQV